jgi:YD repeat-containing protein
MNNYFIQFRNNIIGINQQIKTPNGELKQMIYSDWTASGRNYLPIEERFIKEVLPFVANTHTDTNTSGKTMTYAYHEAQKIIKKHVNAGPNDILISSNSGMTGVVNKFQRILGLKVHESHIDKIHLKEEDRAVVFITHMEHHSNQTSWLETLADVVIVEPDSDRKSVV